MEELDDDHDNERRPLPMVLLGGLYLFFLMLTMSTFGHPYPLLGMILQGRAAEVVVFMDSIICLYLFLGLMKRQQLTWYLLLGYNIFEMVNTLVNLRFITASELEKMMGQPVDSQALITNNISVLVAIVLLTIFIYRSRQYFSNRSNFLF